MSTYRVLHTSDWHIGKKIGYFSRIGEQQKFLSFLLGFIKNEKIDLLLIAGDIYDSKRPGLEEQKLINDFFYELSFTSCKWCVVITGNHDKRDYFNINKKILSRFNFFLVTGNELSSQVVFLEDRGDIKFIIVCMPYINERLIVDQDCKNIELHNDIFLKNLEKAYKEQISNIIGSLNGQHLHIPRILIAHSFFSNSSVVGSIGNNTILPVSVFGNNFSYVALGHIHNFKKLKDNVVYSGSPIQYSFDEDIKKYVNVLFFSESKLVEQSKVLLPVFGKLYLLQGSFDEVMKDLHKIKNEISCLCYLKIELHEKVDAEFEEQIYDFAKTSLINIFDIYYHCVDSEEESLKEGRMLLSRDEVLSRDEKYFFQEKLKKDIKNGFRRGNKFREEELIALFEEVLLKGRAGKYEDK
ncbi:exonuclease subunit SbcD [Borrelia puertoricensis]|uniref:exonuclease subunit SbcD n=1 Tax=Borrelia puertoricensis TaxID=2756107 RepID=UPI001FF24394|nr:exonuclease subunit SbcD [Borrelia puertoricensis]UPA18280.1 exonuclease subunit SbcD [Borrelia puertoricensis]